MTYDAEHLFTCLVSIHISSFGEVKGLWPIVFKSGCLFLFQSFRISWYFGIRPFIWIDFVKYFLTVLTCLLSLLAVSFAEQKVLLYKLSLSIISFMDHTSGVISKKVISIHKVIQIFTLKYIRSYLLRSLIISCITFRSVIHYELTFVKGMMSVSRLVFLHVDVQLFNQHLLESYLAIVFPLLLCQRSVWGSISKVSSVPCIVCLFFC